MENKTSECDWLCKENTLAHHTDEFSRNDKALVIRRGQPFKFAVTLERPFNDSDTIKLDLRLANQKTALTDGSHIIADNSQVTTGWHIRVNAIDGKRVECSVYSPATAIIGRYEVWVENNKIQG